MITRVTERERLSEILSPPSTKSSSKGKEKQYSKDLTDEEYKDDRYERPMYILSILIKPSLLAVVTDFYEPKKLWDFLRDSFNVQMTEKKSA